MEMFKVLGSALGTFGAIALIVAFHFIRSWRNGRKKQEPSPVVTPATGLPILGGAGHIEEITGVGRSPEDKPVTHGQLSAHCKAQHAEADGRLNLMAKELSDTGNRIKKIDKKIDTLTKTVADTQRDVAVLKDRAGRD